MKLATRRLIEHGHAPDRAHFTPVRSVLDRPASAHRGADHVPGYFLFFPPHISKRELEYDFYRISHKIVILVLFKTFLYCVFDLIQVKFQDFCTSIGWYQHPIASVKFIVVVYLDSKLVSGCMIGALSSLLPL